MAFNIPPPPTSNDPKDPAFRDWFYKIQKAFTTLGSFLFTNLDFTGSNITSIVTRNHADLQNLNTASYTHLTSAQATDLTDGGETTLHTHDHTLLNNLNSATYYHLTQTNHTDLTDAGDTTLHFHSSDRNLANATGVLDETNGGTAQSTYVTGDILYASGANTLSKLPIGTSGQGLLVSGGVPSWGAVSSQVKVYEPTVVPGFDLNVTYVGATPTVPSFVTDSNGDIVMAWGGDYAA
jgi:hypothetical protein